jgi:outer membrane lipoprotein SlyB
MQAKTFSGFVGAFPRILEYVMKRTVMKRTLNLAGVLVLVAGLAGCASSNPDVISRNEAQRMAQVQDGVVLSVRPVVVDGSQSGVGAAVGGAVGAVGGYAGSGVHREGQILGVLAGVAGAAAGNAIERMSTKEQALEIFVQLKSGDRRAVVQAKGAENFAPGDPVVIIMTGGKVRIAKAPAVTPAVVPASSASPAPAAAVPAAQ